MLNVFKFYTEPKELNRSDIAEHMHLVNTIKTLEYDNDAKSKLSPIINVIKRDPKCAFEYARWINRGRWEEGEPTILKSSWYSYMYARYVINGVWKEGEPSIKQDPNFWSMYQNYFNKV